MLDIYVVFLLLLAAASTKADYSCMCNYNVELEVHSGKSDTSSVIGSLYEFDCKEQLSVDQGWTSIAFEHQVGYVKTGPNIETQMCPGNPPDTDKVYPVTTEKIETTQTTTPVATTTTIKTSTPATTTTPVTTTTPATTTSPTTTTPATTTYPTVTTTMPTTTSPANTTTAGTTISPTPFTTSRPAVTVHTLIQGNTSLCPNAVRHFTDRDGGYLAQYDQSCYEIVPHVHHWSYAESDCKSKGGHLVHINNQGEQTFINNLLQQHYNHKVWIGLTDLHHEGRYTWTSGDSVVYTNWNGGHFPRSNYDCVSLDPKHDGHWNEEDCRNLIFGYPDVHAYICQYDIDHTGGATSTYGDGNTHLCSSNIQQYSFNNIGVLGQYGQSCYALFPRDKLSWTHGEQRCKQTGGHLVHISNADEQNFVQSFMNRHMPRHAVWIGLNDKNNEGHFEWTSGVQVTYTNWIKDHSNNFMSQTQEDCVLLVPYKNGEWDDLPCGSNFGFGLFGDTGETHPFMCQYHISSGTALIG